ncbi:SDR family oxidoreductase [Allokutzneria sp. A3M-2-11 16]|uniref:SDR family oxidoreductase n=1 Tax=Allokutzneria sp. A3M-2-11 16 TaxID=2962043 RepID=UPI0020B6BF30|nr:SDR family oxidoreductase [Allokutzneria sp. A3M-2-11 16]MCP3804044.1 SDR family oxidoreductase [Allokutzneria sp. A3M-2-11 16]
MSVSRRTVLGGVAALGVAGRAEAAPSGKVVVITGCSSGFGKLTALTLARAGHRVFATMRHSRSDNAAATKELRAIAAKEGLALDVLDIDIRDDRSVADGIGQVRERAGRIDVLVNNAGIFHPAVMETVSVAELQEFFNTNVFGHLRMNRAVLPIMRGQRAGLVVQLTTALGRLVLPFMGPYVGSKWAMEAMTEVSRYELSRFGVDVVIVEPGAYNTDFVIPNGIEHYRRHVRALAPEDHRRRQQYGDLVGRAESHLTEDPEAPDPQQVADTIARLVSTPHGKRPLRTFGPGLPPQWAELNETAGRIQRELLDAAGFGDLNPR